MYKLKTVIGLRTHKWGEFEKEIYNYLITYFGKNNVYIVMDETQNHVEVSSYYNKISISKEYLKQQSLLEYTSNSRGLLWLCGDYFYYALSNQVDADYYWLIETDVRFTFNNASDFFNKFSENDHDALLCRFSSATDDWYWSKHAKLINFKPHKCFFPLSRLSRKAINYCLQERRRLTSKCIKGNSIDLYPNDEALVATVMYQHKLSVQSITDEFHDWFQYFTYTNMILHDNYLEKFPRNKVLHPVRSLESIKNRVQEECYLTLSQRTSLTNYIKHLGQYLDHKELVSILGESCFKYITNIVKIPYKSILDEIMNILDKKRNDFELLQQSNKLWIWNKKAVVLDVYVSGQVYTIEYVIDNDIISCNIFSRNNNSNFMKFLINEFKLISNVSGNKIVLLELEKKIVRGDENCENNQLNKSMLHEFISDTINTFNSLLSKFLVIIR